MNRIEKIGAYRERINNEQKSAATKMEKELYTLVRRVQELRPRIVELIDTANACLKNDIEIDRCSKTFSTYDDNYERGTFITNGITHRLGFVKNWREADRIKTISFLGINAGGACGNYHFRTDGTEVFSVYEKENGIRSTPRIEHMKKFLEKFDEFESAFYKYVDSIVDG